MAGLIVKSYRHTSRAYEESVARDETHHIARRGLDWVDKVVSLAGTVKDQQAKIESLTERVIRLEATLELMIRTGGEKKLPR